MAKVMHLMHLYLTTRLYFHENNLMEEILFYSGIITKVINRSIKLSVIGNVQRTSYAETIQIMSTGHPRR